MRIANIVLPLVLVSVPATAQARTGQLTSCGISVPGPYNPSPASAQPSEGACPEQAKRS